MPARSTLARLQQAMLALLLFAASAWVFWRWPHSPAQALCGALAILFIAAIVLAAEFVLLALVGRSDPSLAPSAGELLRSWWNEVRQFYRIFWWRQPFAWREIEDHLAPAQPGRPGVVFIHGFVCNRGFWTPWMKLLRARGQAFAAVNLEPPFGSIDDYADIIESAVRRLTQSTGVPPVLVCHSMGGLAARAWLRRAPSAAAVRGVVTLGSPHHGTWLGQFSHYTNGRQMRLGSPWLAELAQGEANRALPPFLCWYANCDNIVFPVATATLPWAENRLVRGVAHVELGFRPSVMEETLAWIDAPRGA